MAGTPRPRLYQRPLHHAHLQDDRHRLRLRGQRMFGHQARRHLKQCRGCHRHVLAQHFLADLARSQASALPAKASHSIQFHRNFRRSTESKSERFARRASRHLAYPCRARRLRAPLHLQFSMQVSAPKQRRKNYQAQPRVGLCQRPIPLEVQPVAGAHQRKIQPLFQSVHLRAPRQIQVAE